MTLPPVDNPDGQAPAEALAMFSQPEALLARSLGLHEGQSPFPWQCRLLEAFRRGEIPRSLDVPTGLGKTATMAIWLVARILGAPVPRRLVYIVDRRAVVDQATAVAEGLREWVGREAAVREALDLDDRELPVSTLRGKLVDNRAWLENPSIPAIVVGTVDMIGSRLLFEGYRASRKMRPYLAGLLGQDCLFLLDEAHLVLPFDRLLERVALRGEDLRGAGDPTLAEPPELRLLSLSATGRSGTGAGFELTAEDLAHPVVGERLQAAKNLAVEKLEPKSDLAKAAAARAWKLKCEAEAPRRYLIFLDRRKDAEAAHEELCKLAGLDKLKKGEESAADVALLVGARRVFERQQAAATLAELGFLAGAEQRPEKPAFLIATAAGEVGIDLDADDMVGDLVPWERLVQRLGRVNRRGKGEAQIVLLDAVPDKASEEELARLSAAGELLAELPASPEGARDVSPGALRDMQQTARQEPKLAAQIDRASTPAPLYPELDRPTLDTWSMTSLEAHSGRPAIAPWLRGWIEDRPQTTIAWRKHLPVTVRPDRPRRVVEGYVDRYFEAAPLHASEILEVETFQAVDWLAKVASRLIKAARKSKDADPGLDDVVLFSRVGAGEAMRGWRLGELDLGKKDLERRVVGAGGELVVDARVGGISEGMLAHKSTESAVTMEDEIWRQLVAVPYRVRAGEFGDSSPDASGDGKRWLVREVIPIDWNGEGEVSSWLIVERLIDDSATEDDRSAGTLQILAEHQAWAADKAQTLATRMGLSEEAARLLRLAARLHDEGKRASRWQRAFRAPAGEDVYAKTPGPINPHLLDGYRHELGSLLRAERDEELQALPEAQRDLVLHLIASHHGFARPLISTRGCDDAPPSALKRRAQEIALRYWRLQELWGPWGLAWWEALLRAADQQASRDNEKRAQSEARETAEVK